jgi:uncharacterized protein (TIGR03492 family)
MSPSVLFISNGHGEDNHSAYVIRALQALRPDIDILALPIVGEGQAYQRLGVKIIGPTQALPSGGFTYMNRWRLLGDIASGLLALTWGQIRAVRRYGPQSDLVFATGDIVGQTFAYLSGRPFISFISPISSYYEGNIKIDYWFWRLLRTKRCLTIITKDPFTAQDLQNHGLAKAQCGGIPAMDWLIPTGRDLQLKPDIPMLALLPGSRIPEAIANFRLELAWVIEIVQTMGVENVQFRAALVSGVMTQLPDIAASEGWQYTPGELRYALGNGEILIRCYSDAFADIVHATQLVLGMAGLAVEQAVALGKPAVQIAGEGPQFTYRFAEAQNRLLGMSVKTVGTQAATPAILKEAAQTVVEVLQDPVYLEACRVHGQNRFGPLGAARRMAESILEAYETAI